MREFPAPSEACKTSSPILNGETVKSFSQWSMDRPRKLRRYEETIHPRFLKKYAGESLTFDEIYRELLSHTPQGWQLRAGDVLLDIGCGTGWFARKLSMEPHCAGTTIHGVDISHNALNIARARQPKQTSAARVTYTQADLMDGLPMKAARGIWFCGAWHQMGDVRKSLHHVASALADDGLLRIQTYCEETPNKQPIDTALMRLLGHYVFRPGEIANIAHACGCEIIREVRKGMVTLCTMRHAH